MFITDHGEVGWCGRYDGGDREGPCPFCGGPRHEIGGCPQYRLRPDGTAGQRNDEQTEGGDL